MTVVIANFPEATPGCSCPTCEEIREAAREASREAKRPPRTWKEKIEDDTQRLISMGWCPTCCSMNCKCASAA